MKISELKKLAEKQNNRFDIFTGCSPQDVLDLIEDREQLREALFKISDPNHRPFALTELRAISQEALKKSDELES